MSITRAEAIERLEKLIALYEMESTENKMIDYSGIIDTLKFSLTALRPVSREKVWRGEWVHDPETGYEHCDKCSHTISLDDYMNRKPPLFCEMCGDAKTDEAVDIIMRRLETLYETT